MIYIYIRIYIYGLYGSIFVHILGLYPINEPWWATNGTLYSIDHRPYRLIRQHHLFHRWIWSKSTRPGILRGSWLVCWLIAMTRVLGCDHGTMVHVHRNLDGDLFISTISSGFSWVCVAKFSTYVMCQVSFMIVCFSHPSVKNEFFTRVWNSKTMFLTPPPTHTHTQPCTKETVWYGEDFR